jgi:nitrogen fixation NifU-like protein
MNDELRELYQEIILDHNKNPKNFKEVEGPTHQSEGYNPLCGDKVNLTLKVEGGTIADVGFLGAGCAISKASASVMTSAIKGLKVEEAEALSAEFEEMIKSGVKTETDYARLGKLAAFAGVREFPMRVKCASLAWHTMKSALREKDKATTE